MKDERRKAQALLTRGGFKNCCIPKEEARKNVIKGDSFLQKEA
jgi:hypothetical protein